MPADTDGTWRPPALVPSLPGKLRDKRGANPIDDARGLFVIHAVHLHTGEVLWFCGHAETLDYPLEAYLFDPRKPTAAPARKPFPGGADLFCCHYVQLADGRILVVGGSQPDHVPPAGTRWNPVDDYRGSRGLSAILLFNPRTKAWETPASSPKLLQGRWYPTAVVLGDGSVLVFSGRRERPVVTGPGAWDLPKVVEFINARGIADVVEHVKPPDFKPQAVTGASKPLPIYPGIHLAPDDRLYTTHTTWGQEIPEPNTLSLTVVPPASGAPKGTAATGTWTEYVLPTAKAKQPEREEGMSVMLPVVLDPSTKKRNANSVGKFLVIGGGFAVDSTDVSLVRARVLANTAPFAEITPQGRGTIAFAKQKIATPIPVEMLDTSLPGAPRWTTVTGLTHPRINGHCVLLPDATVLILGGHDNYKWHAKASSSLATSKGLPRTNPTLPVEIYTPGVGFHVGAPMKFPRMYHSIAMLLADGSVIVAGGADPNEHEPPLDFTPQWEGRTYASTMRIVSPAGAGATTLTIDLTPSVFLNAFAELPVGTRVIVRPGPTQFVTTLKALRPVPPLPPAVNAKLLMDINTPLPAAIGANTKVAFESSVAGTPLPRVNEWITNTAVAPAIDAHVMFTTPLNRKDYEIYQPPYFHKGARPVLPPLKAGEVQVSYDSTFVIRTDDAARITRVAIMRPGAVTHHTDTEQRFVELEFTANGTTSLSIKMVPATDSSLVPPGYYMLWILAGALPCVEARFIQVVGAPSLRSPAVPTEVAPPPAPPPPPPATPPVATGGSICPLAAASTTIVALAQIAYLRSVRAELSESPGGRRFVARVSRPYFAAGTPLARRLATRPRWRAAVRAVALRPLVAAVARAESLSRRREDRALRHGRLIALLSVVGVGSLLMSPLIALAGVVHVATHGEREVGDG